MWGIQSSLALPICTVSQVIGVGFRGAFRRLDVAVDDDAAVFVVVVDDNDDSTEDVDVGAVSAYNGSKMLKSFHF